LHSHYLQLQIEVAHRRTISSHKRPTKKAVGVVYLLGAAFLIHSSEVAIKESRPVMGERVSPHSRAAHLAIYAARGANLYTRETRTYTCTVVRRIISQRCC